MVDGFEQDPMDGVSMAYTFADAKTPTRKLTQYFDNNGSRGIYHNGWYACSRRTSGRPITSPQAAFSMRSGVRAAVLRSTWTMGTSFTNTT